MQLPGVLLILICFLAPIDNTNDGWEVVGLHGVQFNVDLLFCALLGYNLFVPKRFLRKFYKFN